MGMGQATMGAARARNQLHGGCDEGLPNTRSDADAASCSQPHSHSAALGSSYQKQGHGFVTTLARRTEGTHCERPSSTRQTLSFAFPRFRKSRKKKSNSKW